MRVDHPRSRLRPALVPLLVTLLTACMQQSGVPPTVKEPVKTSFKVLGVAQIPFSQSGLGAQSRLGTLALTPIKVGKSGDLTLYPNSDTTYFDDANFRYFKQRFDISYVGSTPANNVTFLAAESGASTPFIPGTPFIAFDVPGADPWSDGFNSTFAGKLARQMRPIQPLSVPNVYVAGEAGFQAYTEADVSGLNGVGGQNGTLQGSPAEYQVTNVFPYGFVAHTPGGARTVSVGQKAQVTFAFKIPLQVVKAETPSAFMLEFLVVSEDRTRVSQAPGEDLASAQARVHALRDAGVTGTVDVALVGTGTSTATCADCTTVRVDNIRLSGKVGQSGGTVLLNPPTLNPIGSKIGEVGTPLTFRVTATDPGGAPPTLSTGNLPEGATFDASTGEFSWTPSTAGTSTVTFKATNISGEFDDEKVSVHITDASNPYAVLRVPVTVNRAEASGLARIVTPVETANATAGTVRTFVPRHNALLAIGQDDQGQIVAMDALTLGEHQTIKFNAERSAVALVLTSPEMFGVGGKARVEAARLAVNHPSFAPLVEMVRASGRITFSGAENALASEIAGSITEQFLTAQSIPAADVQALIDLFYSSNMRTATNKLQSQSVVAGQIVRPQAVECNIKDSAFSFLDMKQEGNILRVNSRSPLAVNLYIVPATDRDGYTKFYHNYDDIKNSALKVSYISPPSGVTPIPAANLLIGNVGIGGVALRNTEFDLTEMKAKAAELGYKDTDRFKVYADHSHLDFQAAGSPVGVLNNAGVVNTFTLMSSIMDIAGFGFDIQEIENKINTPAVIGLAAAFGTALNGGDIGLAAQGFAQANTLQEKAEQATNLLLGIASFIGERKAQFSELFAALSGTENNTAFTDSIDSLIKSRSSAITQSMLKKAAVVINAIYATGVTSLYSANYINEHDSDEARFANGFVTVAGSDAEGKGCFAVPPTPPTPAPLPPVPPVNEPDPDLGRGNDDGSDDGGQGPTLPFATEPGHASSYGDPHISTFEQQVYSFQAAGEFILAQSRQDNLVVQARYVPLAGTQMSANAGLAMMVEGDRVGIYATKAAPQVIVNGFEFSLSEGQPFFTHLIFGGSISYDGRLLMVSWRDGTNLTADVRSDILGRVTMTVPASRRGTMTGLLGNFDGDTSNDFQTRSGTVLSMPVPTPTLYSVFGESWRITEDESLFDYALGESTYTFTNRGFPSSLNGLWNLTVEQQSAALEICKNAGIMSAIMLKKCTVDVAVTDNPDWAYFSAGVDPNIPDVTIAPLAAAMLTGTTRDFSGMLSGPQRLSNRELRWTVTGGEITSVGSGVQYIAPAIPGEYILTATSVADPTLSRSVTIKVTEPVGTISGETRFVLRWGETPRDLDAHLWLPEAMPYHVYWGDTGSDDTCPRASLDIDDTNGFGPEVIRVSRLVNVNGVYQLWVHNYSRFGTFVDAQASIEIVDEKGTANVITPPTGEGYWWHVLSLDAQTGGINLVNTVGDLVEPYPYTWGTCITPNSSARGLNPASLKPIWTPSSRK